MDFSRSRDLLGVVALAGLATACGGAEPTPDNPRGDAVMLSDVAHVVRGSGGRGWRAGDSVSAPQHLSRPVGQTLNAFAATTLRTLTLLKDAEP